eukprot:5983807-Pyramimonas_sp.AAC.1
MKGHLRRKQSWSPVSPAFSGSEGKNCGAAVEANVEPDVTSYSQAIKACEEGMAKLELDMPNYSSVNSK